jgi:hypothetical protein
MVTTVTIPKDKRPKDMGDAPGRDDVKDQLEHLIRCRGTMDLVGAFIADTTQDELINWGAGPGASPKLPPEKLEEQIKAGMGASGISAIIEPTDLDLYRSFVYPPLLMPEKPEVGVSLWDFNRLNPVTRFQEGRITVKVLCPDGEENWLVISVPVPNLLMCYMGVVWGWPKYVADEMTVTPTSAEVIYEGEVRLSLEMTPGGVDDEAALRERGTFEFGKECSFHVDRGGACPIRITRRDYKGPAVPEWEAGMVKVYMRPEDPWSGLIPANCVVPGVYQRHLDAGGSDYLWQKIKG